MAGTEFSIRPATPDDSAAVEALLVASYGALFAPAYSPRVLDLALPLMTRANPRLLSCGTFYLAEAAGGGIVGCGGWTAEPPGGGEGVAGTGHIRHFATHPDWTRRGIGRALVARSVEAARKAGVAVLECQSSLVAESFYRAERFATVGPIEIELAPGVTFSGVLMRRNLT